MTASTSRSRISALRLRSSRLTCRLTRTSRRTTPTCPSLRLLTATPSALSITQMRLRLKGRRSRRRKRKSRPMSLRPSLLRAVLVTSRNTPRRLLTIVMPFVSLRRPHSMWLLPMPTPVLVPRRSRKRRSSGPALPRITPNSLATPRRMWRALQVPQRLTSRCSRRCPLHSRSPLQKSVSLSWKPRTTPSPLRTGLRRTLVLFPAVRTQSLVAL